jgi:hypothetical protein
MQPQEHPIITAGRVALVFLMFGPGLFWALKLGLAM